MRHLFFSITLLMGVFLGSSSLFAFKIHPTTITLTPSRSQTLVNLNTVATEGGTFEVYAANRVIDIDGNDTWERDDTNFFIFPSQVILKPNQHQVVRLIWKGKEKVNTEKAYRLIFSSLPVEKKVDLLQQKDLDNVDVDPDNNMSCAVMVAYDQVLPLYVQPDKKRHADVKVKKCQKEKIDGEEKLAVYLANEGSVHKVLENYTIELKPSKGKGGNISLDNLPLINVLSGGERRLLVPLPKEYKNKVKYQGSIEKKKVS